MQKIIIIVSVLAMLLLREECHGQSGSNRYTAGINYTVGVPTFVPNGNVSKVAIDTGTMKWYEYAQVGGWRWSGDRVQDISGCAAPAYTPGKAQSRLVLNSCTEAQNGHGPELYKYTGSAWLCLNCGGNYTAGDGIEIVGTEITNTGDLSNTNELQTLSISNDTLSISNGNSVVLPGGGVTWPLLAPNGTSEAPSYSFEDNPQNGLFQTSRSLVLQGSYDLLITTIEAIEEPAKGIFIKSGNSEQGDGGPFEISAGNSVDASGGTFVVSAGNSEAGTGGTFVMAAGNGVTGGGFTMNAGDGTVDGGQFAMKAGDGTESPGSFDMRAGNAVDGDGGAAFISGGISENSIGGPVYLYGGGSLNDRGGSVVISGGDGPGGKGSLTVNHAIVYYPITIAVRNADTPHSAGKTIFCVDCTANDSSTGVLQTYNGTAWKNHW